MSKYIHIQGLRTAFTESGSGDAVLILHGWGCTKEIFASLQKALETSYRVFVIDLPGFGESEPPKQVWGIDYYTRFVEDFVKEMNLQKPVLIGHSFGGRISIVYASRNSNLKKIILIDAAGVKPKRSLMYYIKVYSYKALKNTLLFLFGKEKGNLFLDKYRKQVGTSDYNNCQGIMRPILSKVVNEDLKHLMPKISVPSLLLWGVQDTATPLRDAYIMEKLIPDAGLVKFPGAGHYSFLDQAQQTHIIIKNFLLS